MFSHYFVFHNFIHVVKLCLPLCAYG
uniref:Uncharacterized protein n=1 Tax=Rhizophora mucronata TaxID=61149 RepID=A0A2P2PCA5_RHIMU